MARRAGTQQDITEYNKKYSKATSPKAQKKAGKDNTENKKQSRRLAERDEYTQQPEKKRMSLPAALAAGLFCAFILELSNFNVLGFFGKWVKYVQFGLFGTMAWVFPFAVIFLFIGLTLKEKRGKRIFFGVVLFIFMCAFSHLLSSHSLNNHNILSYFRNCAQSLTGGGITGGTLALGMYMLLSEAGAVIICILVMLICLFFIFEDRIKNLFTYVFERRSSYEDDEDGEEEYKEYSGKERRRRAKTRRYEPDITEYDIEDGFDEEYYDSYFRDEKARRKAEKKEAKKLRGSSLDRRSQFHDGPVYVSEDENEAVIRIVRSKTEKKRQDDIPLVRSNNKAEPMRRPDAVYERAGRKVRGVTGSLEMAPYSDDNDEVHEITRRQSRREDISAAASQQTHSGSQELSAVSQKSQSDVQKNPSSEKTKPHRPARTRKNDNEIPGQHSIDADAIRSAQPSGLSGEHYCPPPMELLSRVKAQNMASEAELEKIAGDLEIILEQFGVNVTVTDIQAGPSVTRFELAPELGTRVSKITSLADDLKLNLGVTEIRIEAPVPGRQAVGIEIPNKKRQTVYMRELLEEPTLINHPSKIAFAAGKDISGNVVVADIAKMPHLLVAGTTGSGKSVFLNTILMTILYRAKPSEVGLIIIDPKKVEFGIYSGIPHLMKDVVTDPGQAVSTLRWAVNEMSLRYQRMQLNSVRDFKAYNAKVEKGIASPKEENPRKMNQIVIIIDELADLMMVAKKEAEALICRLAQLARAAGIHLIIATQRPSVDVVTGLIKANVPARVALLVSSQIDSRTIIDMQGAEKLLGNGDMLFYPTGYVKPVRVQGAFVSDDEVQKTVDFLTANNTQDYFPEESQEIEKYLNSQQSEDDKGDESGSEKYDEFFYEAGRLCIEMGKASSSMLQRRFSLGFNRAARIIEQLEEFGAVGPQNGAKPRQILVDLATFEEMYSKVNSK